VVSHLENEGFEVMSGERLVAKKRGQRIFMSRVGYCYSNRDPTDVMVPMIPKLLSCAKEKMSEEDVLEMYFRRTDAEEATVRLSPRIEYGTLWRELRKNDLSALTPDEALVYSRVLKIASGMCALVADFPLKESKPFLIGRKIYYESHLRARDSCSVIRTTAERGDRNLYLPQSGIIRFGRLREFTRKERREILSDLGEWCMFDSV
jgi:hypothetical protein